MGYEFYSIHPLIRVFRSLVYIPLFHSIWDLATGVSAQEVNAQHTEFVCGLDWNPQRAHELADCGWDSVVNVYTPKCLT